MNALFLKNAWSNKAIRVAAFITLGSLPTALYVFKFAILNRHGIFRGEDWDEFSQMYEAARQSILHYHQFPWWNPWSIGGEPLFANPQFGLISIPMALVLIFGTVAGLHYTMFVYFILGFWGMYLLLKRVGADKVIALPLSNIWVFSGFPAWHLFGGHETFSAYLLAPWAFLTLLNITKRWGWLWFGLVSSLIINAAPHYLAIQTITICGIIFLVRFGKLLFLSRIKHESSIKLTKFTLFHLYGFAIIAITCSVKLLYTLQFLHEYPRLIPLDPAGSIKLIVAALAFRHAVTPTNLAPTATYGWAEYGAYIGCFTVALFFYNAIRRLESVGSLTIRDWTILSATVLALLLTLGAYSTFSPYALLHNLPVYNQMRVPSRYICWVVFGMILYLAKLPRKPVVYLLLFVSLLDVFTANYGVLNYNQMVYTPPQLISKQFEQVEFYEGIPTHGTDNMFGHDHYRLLRATQSNYGEVFGYEPIFNINQAYYPTNRCGINKGCPFVLTHNAVVLYWSPQKIVIKRTATGVIKLNMNPGKVWYVNGEAAFSKDRILELNKDFVISTQAQIVTISYRAVL